jgi:chromosome segregation ATPase
MNIFTKPATRAKTAFSIFLLTFTFLAFTSISSAGEVADSSKKHSPKYLSFYETIDGEKIHWEANFQGSEITSIYKNGKRIPDDLLDDYKDKIYDELDEMRYGEGQFSFRMPHLAGKEFHFDMDELHQNLEELKKDLPKYKEHFKFYQFDSGEFEKEMEELEKELEENKAHIYKFRFDEEEFKEQMEKLEEELEKNHEKFKNFKFHFDWDEEEDTEV